MNVSIIGGGIGGLTVAIALQQKGIRAQVFEAAPQLGRVGKGIWLPTNAMLVLDHLGLGNDIAARGLALKGIEIHDLNSGLLQRIDLKTVQRHEKLDVSQMLAEYGNGQTHFWVPCSCSWRSKTQLWSNRQ